MLAKARAHVQPQNISSDSPADSSPSYASLDNEAAIARDELHQNLEQVQAIAPDTSEACFDYINIDFRDKA